MLQPRWVVPVDPLALHGTVPSGRFALLRESEVSRLVSLVLKLASKDVENILGPGQTQLTRMPFFNC